MSETRYIVMTEEELDKRIDYWLKVANRSVAEAADFATGDDDSKEMNEIAEFARVVVFGTHEKDAVMLKRILRGGKINE